VAGDRVRALQPQALARPHLAGDFPSPAAVSTGQLAVAAGDRGGGGGWWHCTHHQRAPAALLSLSLSLSDSCQPLCRTESVWQDPAPYGYESERLVKQTALQWLTSWVGQLPLMVTEADSVDELPKFMHAYARHLFGHFFVKLPGSKLYGAVPVSKLLQFMAAAEREHFRYTYVVCYLSQMLPGTLRDGWRLLPVLDLEQAWQRWQVLRDIREWMDGAQAYIYQHFYAFCCATTELGCYPLLLMRPWSYGGGHQQVVRPSFITEPLVTPLVDGGDSDAGSVDSTATPPAEPLDYFDAPSQVSLAQMMAWVDQLPLPVGAALSERAARLVHCGLGRSAVWDQLQHLLGQDSSLPRQEDSNMLYFTDETWFGLS
jgi:hypothetical protein